MLFPCFHTSTSMSTSPAFGWLGQVRSLPPSPVKCPGQERIAVGMQATMEAGGVLCCSHRRPLQHTRPHACSRPISSLTSTFRRGCSLVLQQQSPRRACQQQIRARAAGAEASEENAPSPSEDEDLDALYEDDGPPEKDDFEERIVQVPTEYLGGRGLHKP